MCGLGPREEAGGLGSSCLGLVSNKQRLSGLPGWRGLALHLRPEFLAIQSNWPASGSACRTAWPSGGMVVSSADGAAALCVLGEREAQPEEKHYFR